MSGIALQDGSGLSGAVLWKRNNEDGEVEMRVKPRIVKIRPDIMAALKDVQSRHRQLGKVSIREVARLHNLNLSTLMRHVRRACPESIGSFDRVLLKPTQKHNWRVGVSPKGAEVRRRFLQQDAYHDALEIDALLDIFGEKRPHQTVVVGKLQS